jgi:hypothetical protein
VLHPARRNAQNLQVLTGEQRTTQLKSYMKKHWRIISLAGGLTVVVALIIAAASWNCYMWRRLNFHVVEPGRLYRAGLPSKDSLQRILAHHPVHTIISFSDDVTPRFRELDQFIAAQKGVIRFKRYRTVTAVPTVEDTRFVLSVIADSNSWPVLIHCEHGKDRTGFFIALHRVIDDGWPFDKALAEAHAYGMNLNGRAGNVVWQLPGVIRDYTNLYGVH